MEKQEQTTTAIVRVAFKVPARVRDALARDAEAASATLPQHCRQLLSPLVPSLLAALAGCPGDDERAA